MERSGMNEPGDLIALLERSVVGQREALEAIATAAIAGGHALLEGPPGLAKTLACRAFAAAIAGTFARVQFTPDLLPSDVVGTRVFDQHDASFRTVPGPVFANVLLADEINRAPAKVQSALLQAMQEGAVTIGLETLPLPQPFLVLATMNPLDAEGTYPLPAAQLDRFLLNVRLEFPPPEDELEILQRYVFGDVLLPQPAFPLEAIAAWRARARTVHVEAALQRYAVELTGATRRCADFAYGAGPRATMALMNVARARAVLAGRSYVLPDDVRSCAIGVLRHRVALNHRALIAGRVLDDALAEAIERVPAP